MPSHIGCERKNTFIISIITIIETRYYKCYVPVFPRHPKDTDIMNVISWLNQVRDNEPKFVISEALGEPAELSTLFEHECADSN